jgi:hypothetical protein
MSCVPPPTVLDELGISESVRQRLRMVEDYDLSFLTDNFNDNLINQGRIFSCEQVYPIIKQFGRADNDIARQIEREFKRFVVLTLIRPGVTHAPSGPVDMFWHFFILHTREYAHFCDTVWGAFQPAH